MNRYYEEGIEALGVVLAVILLVLICFIGTVFNSCSAASVEGGTVVDKYRNRFGTPTLVVELDDNYANFHVSEKEYVEYDIGEIYAEE